MFDPRIDSRSPFANAVSIQRLQSLQILVFRSLPECSLRLQVYAKILAPQQAAPQVMSSGRM